MLCSELVLVLAFVHSGIGLLDLLLYLLLHFFLLAFAEYRLAEAVVSAVLLALALDIRSVATVVLSVVLPVVLTVAALAALTLGRVVDGAFLGDIHFLASAGTDTLPLLFLLFLAVELGKVYLVHNLRTFERSYLDLHLTDLAYRLCCSFLRFGFFGRKPLRSRFFSFSLFRCHFLRCHFLRCSFLGCRPFGCGSFFGCLLCGRFLCGCLFRRCFFRSRSLGLRLFSSSFFCGGLLGGYPFRLCLFSGSLLSSCLLGILAQAFSREGGHIDAEHLVGFRLVILLAVFSGVGAVDDLLEFHGGLHGFLLGLHLIAVRLLQKREHLVGNLCIRIRFQLEALRAEEIHESAKSYVELLCEFA